MPHPSSRAKPLAGLSLTHILADGYTSFPAPLLSSLAAALGVPYRSVGVLIGLNGFSASVGNIVGGLAGDRWKHAGAMKMTVLAGAALSIVCLSMIGVAPGLVPLILLSVTGAFGCGAFHPAAFSLAGSMI